MSNYIKSTQQYQSINPVGFTFTIFTNLQAKEMKVIDGSWETLVKRVENPKTYQIKANCPLIKLATFGDKVTDQGSLRHDSNVIEVTGIEIDYDGELISIAQAADLVQDKNIKGLFYSSPTHTPEKPRWRFIAPLAAPKDPFERYHYVGQLNHIFSGALARESFTLSQTYYVGRVGNHYQTIETSGKCLDEFEYGELPFLDKANFDTPSHRPKSAGTPRMSIDEAKKMLKFINPNCDYLTWLSVGMALQNELGDEGLPLWDDWSAASQAIGKDGKPLYRPREMAGKWASFGHSDRESVIGIGTAIKLAQSAGYKVTVIRSTVAEDFPIEVAGIEYNFSMVNGKIEATQANLLKLLASYQLGFDDFTATYMGVFDEKLRALNESDYIAIQYHAEQLGFKKITSTMVRENVLWVCNQNTFDSAIEWAAHLEWDGVERCKHLLHIYFGAEHNAYTTAASLYAASAMGGRLLEPGCKADAVIVLVGAQGAGKSLSIQSLAPMPATFAEISLHTRDADLSRQLRGKLIGELAELRGLKSKDSEDIKAWISRTTEEWTPKYMEFTKTFKRRLTFWGSTNDDEFLNDVTGNRRWLPVQIKQPMPNLIMDDCHQIWAEAIHIFKTHGVLWKNVQELADDVREGFFEEEPIVDEIRQYLVKRPDIVKMTGKEVWAITSEGFNNFGRIESKQIARAMKVLKWEKKVIRVGDSTFKGYYKVTFLA